MGARKNARETRDGVLPLPSRVSLARPVLSCARHFQASATQARKPPDLRICRVEETGYILSNSIKNGAFNRPGILWTGRLLDSTSSPGLFPQKKKPWGRGCVRLRPDFSPTVVFDAHSLHMSNLHHSRLWFSRYRAYANKITHYTSVISLEFEYRIYSNKRPTSN